MMQVARLDQMIFEVQINEMDAARVRKGQGCEVTVDALPGRVYRGRLVRVSPVAKAGRQSIRVFQTEVELLETDEDIRPGMTARAKVLVKECTDCLRLPLARYYREDCGGTERHVAYVADAKAKDGAARRLLKVRATDGEFTGVLEGLNEGDKVLQRPEGRPTAEECAKKEKKWGGKQGEDWKKWKKSG